MTDSTELIETDRNTPAFCMVAGVPFNTVEWRPMTVSEIEKEAKELCK